MKLLNLAGIGGGGGGGGGMLLTAEAFGFSGTFDSTLDDSEMSEASDFLPRDGTKDDEPNVNADVDGEKRRTAAAAAAASRGEKDEAGVAARYR